MSENHSDTLLKKALKFEYVTIAWNIFEGVVCIILGLSSQSISLIAYGLESSIEVFASGIVVWDLKGSNKKREKRALKFIGAAYLFVSAYICFDAIKSILSGNRPSETLLGILFLIVTVGMMTILGLGKRSLGKKMGSATVLADAKFTLIDGLLSAAVLIGLLCNLLFGWWWMDQLMALFLAGVAFREGLKELL